MKKEIPEEDFIIIRNFALTGTLRNEAIRIYRKHIKEYGCRGTLAMQFMSEVDNIVPDFALRAELRCKLV